MRMLIVLFLVGCAAVFAHSQDYKTLADAGVTTCDSPNSGGLSKWVTSASGSSAAVELRVKVTGTQKARKCVTSWVLHVRDATNHSKQLTVAEREDIPEDNEWTQENSFEINAWSNDGKLILMSQIEAQGDWDQTTPIVYDFKSSKHWRIQLQPLFEKLIPADCYVVYRPMRFASNATIVVSALSTDTDREPGTEPCFKDSLWLVNYADDSISPSRAAPPQSR